MKKILFFLTLFLLLPTLTFAQTPTTSSVLVNELGDSSTAVIQESQVRRCLTYTNNSLREVELSGKDFPINSDVNIVACLQTSDNFLCTTGKSELDSKLNITVSGAPAFSVSGDNPIYTTTGRISTKANLTIIPGQMYYFYGVVLKTTTNNKGEASSIQLTDFDFPDGNLANCQGLMFPAEAKDPYGRVFDAKSLEPIPNISITLLDSNKQSLNIPLVVNPQTTKEDGLFNFVVPSGTYYLNPTIPSNYKFASLSNINSNYKKAYSDILTSTSEQVIENSSSPEHRDIALDPGTNTPYTSNAVKISYGTLRNGNNMVITGRVSHPLTIVHFLQNSKEIGKTVANRWGAYSVILSSAKISSDTQIEVAFEKVDLTKNTTALNNQDKFIKEVMAAENSSFVKSSSFFVDPIPAYIEGVATDSSGRIIANADIKIKIKNSSDTYYETKSNEQGVFKISPTNLPQFNYVVEITNPKTKQVTKLTTYQLSKANSTYLAENKINLMTASKNNKSLISPTTKSSTSSTNANNTETKSEQIKNSPLTESSSVLFTLMILFTIICLIGATLIYLYRKNKEHNA